MNFLGHLYFSNNDPQLQYANLFGDYVKGSNFSEYPQIIQRGIRLHREIDNYIDHHPAVLDLLHHLYEHLPKVSGIAIDLYFDHLLARNWSEFHDMNYLDFINRFYTTEPEHRQYYSTSYLLMLERMKHDNWLFHYQVYDGLIKACSGLSQRISFKNVLSKAPDVFISEEHIISRAFELFMNDAIPHFNEYFEKEPDT